MTAALITLCAAGVAGVLVADLSGRPWLEWLAKPLAAAAFIIAAWHWDALESTYGQWILVGLIFGAAGDVLLIPKSTGLPFLFGMIAFLLGHLCYAIAFFGLAQHLPTVIVSTVLSLALAAVLLRWMLPGVPRRLIGPVLAYHLVIFAMVVLACGATLAAAPATIAFAAIGFAASDIAVARNRFVSPGFVNRAWGIPLYFASQMLMASTVMAFASSA